MTFEEYLAFTADGAFYPSANKGNTEELVYLGLGIAGESGETADLIKKFMRGDFSKRDSEDGNNAMREKLADELGDVLWYWTRLVWWDGFTPEQIMHMNVRKLQARYPKEAKGVAQPFPPPKSPTPATVEEPRPALYIAVEERCATCDTWQYKGPKGKVCEEGHFEPNTPEE